MIWKLTYLSNEEIVEGNSVVVNLSRRGVVNQVLLPNSQAAMAFACAESGGFVLRLDDGDLQLWAKADEDLEFVCRKRDDRDAT